MKQLLLISTLLFICVATSANDDAEARRLIEHSQTILALKNIHLQFNLETINNKGESKSKTLSVSFAEIGDEKRALIEFDAPENVKGTKILTTDYPDKKGIIQIYMPSTGKIQKIRASRNNLKIMGSEIPVTRFSKLLETDFNYVLMGRETKYDTECYKIKIEGNENEGFGIAFVSVDEERLLGIEKYNSKNMLTTVVELSEYMEVDNKNNAFYPQKIRTKNLKTGESTNMEVSSFSFLNKINIEDFNITVSGT